MVGWGSSLHPRAEHVVDHFLDPAIVNEIVEDSLDGHLKLVSIGLSESLPTTTCVLCEDTGVSKVVQLVAEPSPRDRSCANVLAKRLVECMEIFGLRLRGASKRCVRQLPTSKLVGLSVDSHSADQ